MAYAAGDRLVLVDPQLPGEEAWAELDALVAEHGPRVAVLTTIRFHGRSRDAVVARYGAERPRIGDARIPGVELRPIEGADETLLWLPRVRALVAGDRLVGTPDGGLRVCPQSWLGYLPGGLTVAELRDRLRPLLDLPVELVLVPAAAWAWPAATPPWRRRWRPDDARGLRDAGRRLRVAGPRAAADARGHRGRVLRAGRRARSGARVLDCAAGTGELAVGLALSGFEVAATDASDAMIERTRALAAARGVDLPAAVCRWEALDPARWPERFDAVFCVGNSLADAPGRAARRAALARMASVLRPGGLLVLTSRNWARERAPGSRSTSTTGSSCGRPARARRPRLDDRRGWDEPHALEIAVALLGAGGRLTTHAERPPFWPFSHEMLVDDLRSAGLEPAGSTYADTVDRYLVTARRG